MARGVMAGAGAPLDAGSGSWSDGAQPNECGTMCSSARMKSAQLQNVSPQWTPVRSILLVFVKDSSERISRTMWCSLVHSGAVAGALVRDALEQPFLERQPVRLAHLQYLSRGTSE